LEHVRGQHFECPQCGTLCGVHDTIERRWRHLNFFQYRCELVAKVPRTWCRKDGVHQVQAPWAREGSGFTLMMEALMMLLSAEGSGANFKKGRRADSRALGERESLACEIGPKFKLCTRSVFDTPQNHLLLLRHPIDRKADHLFRIVKSKFFLNVSTVGLDRFNTQMKSICN